MQRMCFYHFIDFIFTQQNILTNTTQNVIAKQLYPFGFKTALYHQSNETKIGETFLEYRKIFSLTKLVDIFHAIELERKRKIVIFFILRYPPYILSRTISMQCFSQSFA